MKLTQDQFSIWMADRIKEVKNYNFDFFYDIRTITEKMLKNQGNSQNPVFEEIHLMTRDTGSHLVKPEEDHYKTAYQNNTNVYKLIFCWNTSYFYTVPFVTIEKIK